MSEKLGIKIEGPMRIGISNLGAFHVSWVYNLLVLVSLAFLVVGFVVLSGDIFNLPYSQSIYQILSRFIPAF